MLGMAAECHPGTPPPAGGWVVLSGFMGAGKTTVGRIVAARLGLPFRDLDELIEHRTGRTVAALFAESGEAVFRDLEARFLAELLDEPVGVLALGGGAVLCEANRALLRRQGTLVTLRVSPEVAQARLAAESAHRPLADADPEAFRRRAASRASAYADADLTIETDHRPPERVADDVLAALTARGAL